MAAALGRCRPGGDADQDARAAKSQHRLGAGDELAQHLLGGDEIGDDAVAHRPQNFHRLRRLAVHRLGAQTDRQHLALAAPHLHRHDRGFIDDDAAADHVHERVRRAEVNGDIVGERACHACQHRCYPPQPGRGLRAASP